MIPTDLIFAKKIYQTPQLEVHQWQLITGGTTLPIGSTSIFDPMGDFLETEVEQ
jgi:hypothetical protein